MPTRADFNAFAIFAISGRFICCAIVSSNSVIGAGYIADLTACTVSSASNANSRHIDRVKPSTCDRPGSLLNSPASIFSINRVEIAVFADNLATVILLFFLADCMRRPIATKATVASFCSVSATRFAPTYLSTGGYILSREVYNNHICPIWASTFSLS